MTTTIEPLAPRLRDLNRFFTSESDARDLQGTARS
jgi:hypothetical protein